MKLKIFIILFIFFISPIFTENYTMNKSQIDYNFNSKVENVTYQFKLYFDGDPGILSVPKDEPFEKKVYTEFYSNGQIKKEISFNNNNVTKEIIYEYDAFGNCIYDGFNTAEYDNEKRIIKFLNPYLEYSFTYNKSSLYIETFSKIKNKVTTINEVHYFNDLDILSITNDNNDGLTRYYTKQYDSKNRLTKHEIYNKETINDIRNFFLTYSEENEYKSDKLYKKIIVNDSFYSTSKEVNYYKEDYLVKSELFNKINDNFTLKHYVLYEYNDEYIIEKSYNEKDENFRILEKKIDSNNNVLVMNNYYLDNLTSKTINEYDNNNNKNKSSEYRIYNNELVLYIEHIWKFKYYEKF